ncbi:phosphotransferase [Archangium sp.]|uniref:phosphotransferase n=1 Tax=Archangium sp. TaxID=1872627 RepID=UPI002D680586|nr:phosphotransferase [Archangium sp.]HYO58921.1 phosphotransferase [Archangium sp.]
MGSRRQPDTRGRRPAGGAAVSGARPGEAGAPGNGLGQRGVHGERALGVPLPAPEARRGAVGERGAHPAPAGAPPDGAAVRAWVSRLVDTPPWERRACWVHGDLYARHLLVDEHHTVRGVLDWGDVHLGDPAIDLTLAFTFLPPEARGTFREAYGDIDEATWDRARFRAFHYGVALMLYGQSQGDESITRVGRDALRYGAA